jgi:hypothetical protein
LGTPIGIIVILRAPDLILGLSELEISFDEVKVLGLEEIGPLERPNAAAEATNDNVRKILKIASICFQNFRMR